MLGQFVRNEYFRRRLSDHAKEVTGKLRLNLSQDMHDESAF